MSCGPSKHERGGWYPFGRKLTLKEEKLSWMGPSTLGLGDYDPNTGRILPTPSTLGPWWDDYKLALDTGRLDEYDEWCEALDMEAMRKRARRHTISYLGEEPVPDTFAGYLARKDKEKR